MQNEPQKMTFTTPQACEDSLRPSALSLAQILNYHERSKHHLERYAAGPEALDWDAQPNPFREFAATPRIQLPLVADQLSASFGALHLPNAVTPQPITLENVAALMELAFGLSAWKEYGPDRWAVRCNPSSGNLHPTEAYVICREISGIEDGVYHYLSRDHLLEQRCKVTTTTSGTPSRLLIGLSSISWREAWKYGERAFRYCQLDTGHAIGALRYAAATLGWHVRIVDSCSQQQLAQMLGLDRDKDFTGAEREEVELLLEITTSQNIDATRSSVFESEQTHWQGQANILDAHPMYRWPVIDEVTQASRKPSSPLTIARSTEALKNEGKTIHDATNQDISLELNPLQLPLDRGRENLAPPLSRGGWEGFEPTELSKIKATTLIRQRRSAQRFDAKFMQDAASFYHMLDALLPRPTAPWDVWHEAVHIHPLLFVHRVAGLEPGIYALPRSHAAQLQMQKTMRRDFLWRKPADCPEHLPLFLLAETNLSKAAKIMNCHQAIAGDGTFMLTMLAEFDAPLKIAPSNYRQLYWEAGLLGQVLHLQAEAAGLRGTGIGCYFDDMCHELLGLQDKAFQSLYHFTVGYPLTDERIANLPPYPSISTNF
jgi:SagB-type dehydrogenase family enzyme